MEKTFSTSAIDEVLLQTTAYNNINNNQKTIYVNNNLSRLYKWAKDNKMPSKLFFRDVDDYSINAVKSKKGLISNNQSILMMNNVTSFYNSNPTILRKASFESMKYLPISSKLLFKLFGAHIDIATKILVTQNARMNKTKYFEINTTNIQKNIYETTVKSKTLVGLISPKVLANWNWGHYDWFIKNSLDKILEVDSLFDEQFGGWIYKVKYVKNENNLIDILTPNIVKNHFSKKTDKIIKKNTNQILKKQELIEAKAKAELNQAKYFLETLKSKDLDIANHTRKVGFLTILFAKLLNLPPEHSKNLALSAISHDLGKKYIPLEIINKPGKLDEDERKIINTHGLLTSYYLLNESTKLSPISMGVIRVGLEHHAKFDGSGYGLDLKGNQISLYGQIIGIVDIFDALIEDRPYRKALDYNKTREILQDSIIRNQINKPLGNFFIQEVMPILEEIGYRHDNICFENLSDKHSEIIHDLIGFLKGHNNKFRLEINKSLETILNNKNSGKYFEYEQLKKDIINRISMYIQSIENPDLKTKFLNNLPQELKEQLTLNLTIFLDDEREYKTEEIGKLIQFRKVK